jgi:F-type H+-transporting ATPase subunit b
MESLGIVPAQILINIIGFLVVYWLLRFLLYGPITRALEDRAGRIKTDRDEAARLREDMVARNATLEQRLAGIETEARDRIAAAEREARALREQLLAEARAERGQVVAAGLADLAKEREKLLTEVRDLVADLAVAAAAKIVERELDVEGHRALIDEIVEHHVR